MEIANVAEKTLPERRAELAPARHAMERDVKIKVDYDLCQGHGACKGEAPEVFDVDEERMRAIVLQGEPRADLHQKVRAAAKYCPTQAIHLEE